jgi:hypothetical protein
MYAFAYKSCFCNPEPCLASLLAEIWQTHSLSRLRNGTYLLDGQTQLISDAKLETMVYS